MTKWDKILIGCIIVISLFSIAVMTVIKNQSGVLHGIIEVNGVEKANINLMEVKESYTIKVENNNQYNIVEVSNGSIRFIEATCPDKDCVRIGSLDAPGEISICLPNKITIRVEGSGDQDELDSTTY